MNLLDVFERAYVINLPERADRRAQMERELRRADLGLQEEQLGRIRFFPGIQPRHAEPFMSIGMQGCFLSHLAVLKDAEGQNVSRVLVLEDDAEFTEDFTRGASLVFAHLAEQEWGIVQLGYMGGPDATASLSGRFAQLVEFSGEVTGTHCYGVSSHALRRLIAHLERQRDGKPGDNLYGPMPPDGSINVFRWLNPDLPRFLAVPSLVRQRSSRSDVTPGRLDRIRLLRPVLDLARGIRARKRPP